MRHEEPDIRNRLLVARLPAMPQILLKLIEQCQNEEIGLSALADLVAKDPGMTGKILSVANSSAYHRNHRKFGLEHALMTLGTEMIKTLVISESVFQVFNNFTHSNATDLRAFWKHSLSTAVLARELASQMAYPHAEEAYLAGLLHDVGRLALLATAPREYGMNFLARDDEVLCEIEERTLKITHQEAGAWLVERWNLDSFLSDSVLYHHEPASRIGNTHPLIRIVLLAHLLSDSETDNPAVRAAVELCGIAPDVVEQIAIGADEQVTTAAEYLGIDLSGVDELPLSSATDATQVAGKESAHRRLSEEVMHRVLTAEAARTMEPQRGEAALLEAMTCSARVLFGFEDALILLTNGQGQALVGVPIQASQQRLKEFSVFLAHGGSVAESALQRRPAFIARDGNPLGIVEEQLLRMLHCDALVCIPLTNQSRCLGVLIGGLPTWQLATLRQRERFLRAFGEQAAHAMATALGERSEASRRVATVVEEYREASRKIAHEANNPLSILKNYLSVLNSKIERCEPVSGEISILNEEIDRVGNIIQGLTDLKPAARETHAEANRLIRDIARLFRDTDYVPERVKISVQPQDLPMEVEVTPDTLKQILVNLVKNSIEAMHSGGEIQITNNGHVNKDGTLFVELCVTDNGPGIPPELMHQLFQPVHTPKGGVHQGLGLNIVHGLIKQQSGHISCRSSSKGTHFELLLPARRRKNT